MSFRASAWALAAHHPSMTAHHKWVLNILAQCHNDETDACYPSMEYLTRQSLLSRATVQRCIAQLEEMGLVVRQIGGGRKANRYVLFGVARLKLPPERLQDGYPHPPQGEAAPRASYETPQLLDLPQGEAAPRASYEAAPRASYEAGIGMESESTRPRSDGSVDNSEQIDTRIPAELVQLGLDRIARLRAQLTTSTPDQATDALEAGSATATSEMSDMAGASA